MSTHKLRLRAEAEEQIRWVFDYNLQIFTYSQFSINLMLLLEAILMKPTT